MSYRCVATSVAGFIQQLAVGYISNGYYFYVAGVIPHNKPAEKIDSKILAAYDIAVSRWTRARRKREGQASVQYLRYGRFYVIIATDGVHPFFSSEAKCIQDVRRRPILFQNYSIGYCRERGGETYHASVRINRDYFRELKAEFVKRSTRDSVEELYHAFRRLSFEPYAPIRVQLQVLLRAVNRRRAVAGLDQVPVGALRLRRKPTRPFESNESDNSRLSLLEN